MGQERDLRRRVAGYESSLPGHLGELKISRPPRLCFCQAVMKGRVSPSEYLPPRRVYSHECQRRSMKHTLNLETEKEAHDQPVRGEAQYTHAKHACVKHLTG